MNLSLRKINAIFQLKLQSIITNVSIMVAPMLAVGFVLIMKISMPKEVMTGAFLLGFGVLFNAIMGGIMTGSYPLAEEKEKNTLRVLMTSSVNGAEFIIGSIIPSIIMIIIVNIILVPIAGVSMDKINWPIYLIYTTLSGFISILIGYIIGIYSKNQMQAGNLSMPILLIFTMTPMFQMINKTIQNIASYTYSGTIINFINNMLTIKYTVDFKDITVLMTWLILSIIVFIYAYSKHGLDSE
ncbi:ABC transporter permease [Companilactobacillus jidongensis]|uniref:ABC transporter permease n=1 Tax=Companilactobacillus jidongensis TaxID=2486006 RepID=UPI000F7843C8|nr:ABC transporter permease [Companilactobacillus jidongensis]